MGSRYFTKRIKSEIWKGNVKKTPKAFKTEKEAQEYIKKKGLKSAWIENIGTKEKPKFKVRRR